MIGELIRQKREEKKISQYAVAYCIGMSQAAYSKIERGETQVKVNHIYMIAEVLNVSVYDLLPPSLENAAAGSDYLLKPIVDYLQKFIIRNYVAYRRRKLYSKNR